MNGKTRDERLQGILREADPAEGETGLATGEIRAMRRTMLTTTPEPRRRFALSPVLAGAAMAVLAAIAILMLWPRSESPRTTPPVALQIAVKPRPDMNVRATSGVPSGTSSILVPPGTTASSPAASTPGGKRPRPVRNTPTKEQDRLAVAQEIEGPRNRQIQFDTPGGTRVIWVLTAGNAL